MSHTEAMNAPICCNNDCNQGDTCPARMHTKNGGNTVTNGEALKPVYTGDDVIELTTSLYPVGLFVVLVLWILFWCFIALVVSP